MNFETGKKVLRIAGILTIIGGVFSLLLAALGIFGGGAVASKTGVLFLQPVRRKTPQTTISSITVKPRKHLFIAVFISCFLSMADAAVFAASPSLK